MYSLPSDGVSWTGGATLVWSEGSLLTRDPGDPEVMLESWVGVGGETPSSPGLIRDEAALAIAVFTVKPT